jgi:hypothetical protein
MLAGTLDAVADAGLLTDIDTLHLDRGYDYPVVRAQLAALGLEDLDIQRRGTKEPGTKQSVRLGLRWIVEPPTRGGRTTASFAATPTVVAGSALPRHHRAHRRQTHRLPRPLEHTQL